MNFISDDLQIIEKNRRRLKSDKPIFIGQTCVDISKILL